MIAPPSSTLTVSPPSSPSAAAADYLLRAETYYQEQQWSWAIAACVLSLQHLATSSPLQQAIAHKIWGNALQRQGQLAAAYRHYQAAIALQPDQAELYVNLGSLAAQQQQWSQAIAHYQHAIALQPNFAGAYRNLARLWEILQQPHAAADCWDQAQSLEPTWVEAEPYLNLGEILHQQGKADRAIAHYRQAIQLQPEVLDPYLKLGKLLSDQGDERGAIALYRTALAHHPQQPDLAYRLAQAFGRQHQWERAIAYYRRFFDWQGLRSPEGQPQETGQWSRERLGQWWGEFANALAQGQKWKRAIAYYRHAIQYQPDEWQWHHRLGDALFQQKRWGRAACAYRCALEHSPQAFWSHNNLGNALMRRSQWAEAIQAYEQAVAINDRFFWTYRHLGQAHLELGQLEQAIANYQQALQLEPHAPVLHYDLGNVLRQQGQFSAAVTYYCQTIRIDPTHKPAYIALQFVPIAPGQRADVIATYRAALQQAPDYAMAWSNLGDVLTQAGDRAEAIACYRTSGMKTAIALHPHLASFDWTQPKQHGPDFLIIGAAKCGTSSLYSYLKRHPQILLPCKKELSFFTTNFDYGIAWYLAQFPTVCDRPDLLTGEADPNYIYTSHVAERVARLFPQTKLIILLRNPVDRACSWYYHMVRTGFETRPFSEVIEIELARCRASSTMELTCQGSYLAGGIYWPKIRRWQALFPKDQIQILRSETLFANPGKTTQQAVEFLGLSPQDHGSYLPYNAGSYPPLERSLKAKLAEFFKPYNQELESQLCQSFYWDENEG
ncbi:MAG: tetratricopeptide repeat protein [Synechococcales bacterium]|nr:tetratricopeptide repeat protein [Synechococcales bacterium]